MLTTVLFSVLLSTSSVLGAVQEQAEAAEPAVEVWLNKSYGFDRGDRARVYVRTAVDGYLLVLQADPDGRVRVLFPLDPVDDDYIRGSRNYEIRSRGNRTAFRIYESSGLGVVYAAFSRDPFRFDEFVRGDHWDYRAAAWVVSDYAEADLTELVQRMTVDGDFDYDVATYEIRRPIAWRPGYGYYSGYYDPYYYDGYGPRFNISFQFGAFYGHHHHFGFFGRRHHGFFYDPFFYDPFYYDPFFYGSAFYGPRYVGYYPTYVYYRPAQYPVYRGRYSFKASSRFATVARVRPRSRVSASTARTGRRVASQTAVTARPRPVAAARRRAVGVRSSANATDQSRRRVTPTRSDRRPGAATDRRRRGISSRSNDVRSERGTRPRVSNDRSTRRATPREPDRAADTRRGTARRRSDNIRPIDRPRPERSAAPRASADRSSRRVARPRSGSKSSARSRGTVRQRPSGVRSSARIRHETRATPSRSSGRSGVRAGRSVATRRAPPSRSRAVRAPTRSSARSAPSRSGGVRARPSASRGRASVTRSGGGRRRP